MNSLLSYASSFAILSLATVGCCGSGGLVGTVPIRGQVVYDGQPLTDAEIRYVPVDHEHGRIARSAIDAGGNFQLTTLKSGDGALPGEYSVLILAYVPGSGGARGRESELTRANDPYAQKYEPKSRIPVIYTRPEMTPLTDTVDADHSGYKDFVLESEDATPDRP